MFVAHPWAGRDLSAATTGTAEYHAYWLIKVFAYCAVDAFAIISGYTANGTNRKFEKLAEMWFQAVFYSFFITLLFRIFGFYNDWGFKDILKCLMPVIFGKFWYFTAFFLLYFAIPVLNKYLFSVTAETAKKAFFLLVVLFSILSLFTDPFVTNYGYSAIWLIALYCIGVLAKRIALFEKRKSLTLILIWGCCILLSRVFKVFLGIQEFVRYISPTILLSGLIMVILFSRLKCKGTVIKKITPYVFGIYLFQLNQVIWNNILKDSFQFVVSKDLFSGILSVLAIAVGILASGFLVEFIRSKIAGWIKIPEIS